ncbi:MAG: ornithine carbamoyltransferase [Candidatus Nanohaloarchaeota archaeon QJJ-7]|nr:ornithine carbamoyltransferase [Candidatus Nanohaloarchaeota archaeon QJJ-7]
MDELIDVKDLDPEDIEIIYDTAQEIEDSPSSFDSSLSRKTLLMLFSKPSTRTRVSFETGMTQLGGHAINMTIEQSQMSRGEAIKDTSKVLSRYVDGVMARIHDHEELMEFSAHSDTPVINGLTDKFHPCQALSDLYTLRDKGLELEETEIVFLGDGNNVAQSLIQTSAKLGADVKWSGPQGEEPESEIIEGSRRIGSETGSSITVMHDPHHAVQGADVIYTDVFQSMGEEKGREELERFRHYQVDEDLIEAAGDPYFMHPLPAKRGEEVTAEVLESDNSIVYDQAENRLHVQKAILKELLSD